MKAKVRKSVVCVGCGVSFEVIASRAGKARYCSRGRLNAAQANKFEAARIKRTCPGCGKVFSFPPCHSERRRFCSHDCAVTHKKYNPSRGKDHYAWRGVSEHSDGYLYLRLVNHPKAASHGYVFEHRLVVEDRLKREAPDHPFLEEVDGVKVLRDDIDVHHINEVKADNRPKNLLACTKAAHRSIHNGRPPMVGEVWPEIDGCVPFEPYKMEMVCGTCGTTFLKKRSDVKRGSGKYCSRDCYNRRKRKAFAVNFY